MWAIARYDLRLTGEEFWDYTLRQVFLLLDRWEGERKHQQFLAGIVASTIANCNRDPKKGQPFTPQDFMPGQRKQQTVEDHLKMLTAITQALGGEVN